MISIALFPGSTCSLTGLYMSTVPETFIPVRYLFPELSSGRASERETGFRQLKVLITHLTVLNGAHSVTSSVLDKLARIPGGWGRESTS